MIVLLAAAVIVHRSAPLPALWEIGKADGTPLKFGLAPDGFGNYKDDPYFVVGRSRTTDWPYVIPGPMDSWAGSRIHEGGIAFGLSGVRPMCSARLVVRFSDIQSVYPPRLKLLFNGTRLAVWQAPPGHSDDDVISGRASSGITPRWSVTVPGNVLRNGNNTVAIRNERGSWALYDSIEFDADTSLRSVPVTPQIVVTLEGQEQMVLRTPNGPCQPIQLNLANTGEPADARISVGSGPPSVVHVRTGGQNYEASIPPKTTAQEVPIRVDCRGRITRESITVQPVRPWTIYLFPHAHVDIGYTGRQADVLKMHQRNLFDAIAVAKDSAPNPSDSRYRFNAEATWILDRLVPHATQSQTLKLGSAFRDNTLCVSADYANLLTGLMHPEELMQSYRYSRILQDRLGARFDTATQSDVPGVTWGDVVALHEAGVKYLVLMPNPADRIGGVRRAWQDKPFFWVDPSGQNRVLVWETDTYGIGTVAGFDGDRSKVYTRHDPSARFIGSVIFSKLNDLLESGYPYDMVGLPWSFTDNPPIDGDVPEATRAWNDKYLYPHVVLSTWTEACETLVRRYGKRIPSVRGDFTPYWEDGSGSSAAETAINRETPDRLLQAAALFAIRQPRAFPTSTFLEAWRNVLLYSEHTWGAYNSVSQPDDPLVKAEWASKRSFALTGEGLSRSLLAEAAPSLASARSFVVYNTSSWPRSDLVIVPRIQSREGNRVEDGRGCALASQRLGNGDLAVLARHVPAFGCIHFRITPGKPLVGPTAYAAAATLRSADYAVSLDRATGAISSIKSSRAGRQIVQERAPYRLNQFLYLPGDDLKSIRFNTPQKFEVINPGPLVATIRVTSQAPGSRRLQQEVTLVGGLDRIDIENVIDKLPVRSKESVHFAFPLNVPNGHMRIGMAWSVVRPDLDQIAGANKNWLPARNYVDVSDASFGVTWASPDAPLVEVGSITANRLGGMYSASDWLQHLGPTQTFYSWALNNIWYTNYCADQAGKLVFRYRLQSHGAFRPDVSARFAIEEQQPLILIRASGTSAVPPVEVGARSVLVTRLSPTDDRKAIIVRLWNASSAPATARLRWRSDIGRVTLTDLSQHLGRPCGPVVRLPGYGVLTLRADLRN